MPGPNRNAIGHWYGPKELKRPNTPETRAAFAKYQADVAEAVGKAQKIAQDPAARCSACGHLVNGKGSRPLCRRGHPVVSVPHGVSIEAHAASVKAAEEAAAAETTVTSIPIDEDA